MWWVIPSWNEYDMSEHSMSEYSISECNMSEWFPCDEWFPHVTHSCVWVNMMWENIVWVHRIWVNMIQMNDSYVMSDSRTWLIPVCKWLEYTCPLMSEILWDTMSEVNMSEWFPCDEWFTHMVFPHASLLRIVNRQKLLKVGCKVLNKVDYTHTYTHTHTHTHAHTHIRTYKHTHTNTHKHTHTHTHAHAHAHAHTHTHTHTLAHTRTRTKHTWWMI